jgi:nucleoside-diphosphate-sugar epimerase
LLLRRWTPLPSLPGVEAEIVWGDLGDEASLKELIAGADAVVHAAGLIKARRPVDFDRVNRDGTARLSALAPDLPFLLLSSLAAREPQLSPYAASKRAAEEVVTRRSGPWLAVRAPAVYGPGDRETLAYFRMAARGFALQPDQPDARLSLIHVEDLVEALASALDRHLSPGVYEIDDGHPGGYRHTDMAAAAAEALGRPVRTVRVPRGAMNIVAGLNSLRPGAQILSPAKVRELYHSDWTVHEHRLAEATGFAARFGLGEGFRHTILWYRCRHWL